MIRPTFMGLSTGVSGLQAAQKSLDIVGNNISNANTEGYTRQQVDLYETPTICGSRLYSYQTIGGSGLGVTISGTSQIRDSYLDLRYRNLAGKTSASETYASGMSDVESLLSEVTVDGISVQLQDFMASINDLAENPGKSEFESLAQDAANTLVKEIRNAANTLSSLRDENEYNMQNDIDTLNQALADIAELNKTIKNEQILGNEPLELLDQRNLLIDNISKIANIDVEYQQKTTDAGNITYDELKLSINGTTILDHNQYGEFSMSVNEDTNAVTISYTGGLHTGNFYEDRATQDVDNFNADITAGTLSGYMDLLNESGEFDSPSSGVRGIGYFEQRLDLLASSLADIMNTANTLADGTKRNLFESDDGGEITASTIKLSDGWLTGQYGITNTKKDLPGDSTGANDNYLYIYTQFTAQREFTSSSGNFIYSGSLEEYTSDIADAAHSAVSNANTMVNLRSAQLSTVEDLRDSVSSVSLNEEAVDMMKYQKSYSACAQYISVINDLLDTLINNVGQVR
jgi:flagellar hook-associated protein 1 FlgK